MLFHNIITPVTCTDTFTVPRSYIGPSQYGIYGYFRVKASSLMPSDLKPVGTTNMK